MNTLLSKIRNKETKNILLFSIGYFISLSGSSIYTFIIGLYVLKLTGSAFSFATTLALSIIPTILINPFAGVLADRLNRKVLVVVMDFCNGVILMMLYVLCNNSGFNITLIYISTFIINCMTCIFSISITSAKPNMVSESKLVKLNSIDKVISATTLILGPLIGGLLFTIVDIDIFIVVNAISFIISAILELFLEFNLYKEKCNVTKGNNFISDIHEGFRYVITKKDIISLIVIFICINFSIGFSIQTPLPFIINNILKLSSTFYGIIQSAFAIGLIIGAISAEKYIRKISLNKLMMSMSCLMAICIFVMSIPIHPYININNNIILVFYYCLVISLIGIAIALIDISFTTYLQKNIANEYRGRVMSLELSLIKTVVPVSLIISGCFIELIPVYILLIIGAIMLFVSSIIWYKKDIYCKAK